jgi:hypothetical protein
MAALSNKDYKQGWLSGYYPYNYYTIVDNNLVLGGDVIKVNNEILTKDIIKESNSGFDSKSTPEQTGGRGKVKKYKIKSDSVEGAFKKLEGKVRGEGDILVLQLKSLDDKNKVNFYKIYRKKM